MSDIREDYRGEKSCPREARDLRANIGNDGRTGSQCSGPENPQRSDPSQTCNRLSAGGGGGPPSGLSRPCGHSEEDLQLVASNVERSPTEDPRLVLACTFEGGLAEDVSGHGNDGTILGAEPARGKFGRGMQFTFRQARGGNTFVQHTWTKDVPVIVRALVKANDLLFVAGPPDLINEEETFERVMGRDPRVAQELAEQDAALEGQRGGRLLVVSAKDGSPLAQYQLESVPSWDGMAAARGKLYLSTADGKVLCFAPAP